MNINELTALAFNLDGKDEKASFMALVDELARLNGAIELGNGMIEVLVGSVNELKEDRDRIAKDLNSYFSSK